MTRLNLPAVAQLDSGLRPVDVFLRLRSLPHVIFFDSALRHPKLGRYSYIAADPFAWLELPADEGDALTVVQELLAQYSAATEPGLPPFQGGAAGMFGYELGRSLERIPRATFDEFQVPAVAVGLYDVVFAFDHEDQIGWIISQGFPEQADDARHARSAARLRQFSQLLSGPPPIPAEELNGQANSVAPLTPHELAPQHNTRYGDQLTSNFSPEGYRTAVRQAIDYIYAGDVFQVNLSQRLLYPARSSPVELYLRLRERNAAPFAGYFDMGSFQLCSASPERFLAIRDGHVETRPIKGTRPRAFSPEADLFAGDDLRDSQKDRAENVMIVDLLRNDLAKVCEPDSIHVSQLCELESYAYVQHLVSAVEGHLKTCCSAMDQLRAAFPGGSITGAPKVRAMEIIAELEPTVRGPYCGSLAFIGLDGRMDSSILIRTFTAGRGWWQFSVGGGIIADSNPQLEYEETWHKAEGLIRALRP